MNRTEQAAAKRKAELTEALGHLEFFKRKSLAIQKAIIEMQSDVKICNKEIKIWEGRIEKMGGKP